MYFKDIIRSNLSSKSTLTTLSKIINKIYAQFILWYNLQYDMIHFFLYFFTVHKLTNHHKRFPILHYDKSQHDLFHNHYLQSIEWLHKEMMCLVVLIRYTYTYTYTYTYMYLSYNYMTYYFNVLIVYCVLVCKLGQFYLFHV